MAGSTVAETTAATFDTDVIARSHERPVVVDFWADWCGPCHQLAPVLERVAARHASEVDVYKLDVDAAPELARRYRVQGIPSIKAFRDGQVVAELTGVQSEQAFDDMFARITPSKADRLVAGAGDTDDPEATLWQALELEPGHVGASLALAERLAERGEVAEAERLLDAAAHDDRARELRSRLALAAAGMQDVDALRRAATEDPQARVALGRALAGRGEYEEAVEELLAALTERSVRDEAREAMLEIFSALGDGHELVRRARPRLASALYA